MALVAGLVSVACSSGTRAGAARRRAAVRIAYSADLTQSAALIGVHEGLFAQILGPNTRVVTLPLPDAAAVAESLRNGSADFGYLDANDAYAASVAGQRRRGHAPQPQVVVIAGAASGGVSLVTAAGFDSPESLRGHDVALPAGQAGPSVALATWLASAGIDEGGREGVTTRSVAAPDLATTFAAGGVAGVWAPEPWASEVAHEGGHRLLDERTLWPGGSFASAVLVARRAEVQDQPSVVLAVVRAHVAATDLARTNVVRAQGDVAAELSRTAGRPVAVDTVRAGWDALRFTQDPLVPSLQEAADHARPPGSVEHADLRGFIDVHPLNQVLAGLHRAPVAG